MIFSTQKKPKKTKEEKQALRRARKKRNRLIRRIVFAILLVALLVVGFRAYRRLYPLYVEAKDRTYEVIAEMDAGTFKRESNTKIFDAAGDLIGKVGFENYEYVDISRISDHIQRGYIAQEDKNFTAHGGVDYKALVRAAWKLVRNRGAITQGGSTITMQVVKNNLLSQERSYDRKVLEILIARQIEKEYNKAEIMEFYCNSNYYGNSCYGVEGASRYYFGKHADSLTLAEAAILVGTSNRPNAYNPVADYALCMQKKEEVLGNMLENGDITQAEHDAAVAERPEIVQMTDQVGSEDELTTYALHCASWKLMEHDGFAFQYTFDSEEAYTAYQSAYDEAYTAAYERIRSGGFTIETSLDQKIQAELKKATEEVLAEEDERAADGQFAMQSASICIDNATGMAVAVLGGRGGSYNRAYLAQRPAGSAIKPLVDYAPALNEGVITPAREMKDEAVDINGYKPKNYAGNYRGNVTVREAVARSINTIAVQTLMETSPEVALGYLGKLQFHTLSFADNYNASVALGSTTNGVTVEDMAHGYATLANGGKARDNSCIVSLVSETEGEIFHADAEKEEEVFNPDTAFMMTDMLQGVFREEYGTAHDAARAEYVAAGKTGTTNDNHDGWFGGYTPDYTTVTWVGYDAPREHEALVGSGYPLAIWSAFMDQVQKGKEKKEFPVPQSILLVNADGDERQVDYAKDIYESRPDGYDYISGTLRELAEQKALERRIAEQVEAAEKEVRAFEDFQIMSTEDARSVDERYNEVLVSVEKIEDAGEQKPFKERIAKHYAMLTGEIRDRWEDVMREEEEREAQEREQEQQRRAQESVEEAASRLKEKRITAAESYIDMLYESTVFSETLEQVASDGRKALEACRDYDEYASLSEQLTDAIAYMRELPTEEQVREETEQVATPTPIPTTTVTPSSQTTQTTQTIQR